MNDLTKLIKQQFDDIGSLILTPVWAKVKNISFLFRNKKSLTCNALIKNFYRGFWSI